MNQYYELKRRMQDGSVVTAVVTAMTAAGAVRAAVAGGVRLRMTTAIAGGIGFGVVVAARPGRVRPVVSVQGIERVADRIVREMMVVMAQRILVQGIAGMMERIAQTGDGIAAGVGVGEGIFLAGIHQRKAYESSKQKEILHAMKTDFFNPG